MTIDSLLSPGTRVRRLLNVTHQLPFEVHHDARKEGSPWRLAERRGHDAMYSGIRSLKSDDCDIYNVGWIGHIHWHGENDDDATPHALNDAEKAELTQLLLANHCLPLFLNVENIIGHYDGYCKTMLWPLLHYIIWNHATDGRLESQQWRAYQAVNRLYADLLMEMYEDGDIVWVHDYHLLLVSSMVREMAPLATIGLFVHSPWPTSEIFRCLPKRQELLRGMMASTMIGFQTYGYARHFISTCTRVLGCESTPEGVKGDDGHFCYVVAIPIGIHAERIEQVLAKPTTIEKMASIRELYPDKKIFVARDKMDLVKGVLQKLETFERFLAMYPQWRNKVVLIQLTDAPVTITKSEDIVRLESKISTLVARINGQYGSLEFSPVYHYPHHVLDDEYHGLLAVADVALITSNRDGISTIAYEYIICQEQAHNPLIVSEISGTAASLSSALIVNPWDMTGVARAIHEALVMSPCEKKERHQQLLHHVKTHTSAFWAHAFLKRLQESVAYVKQANHTRRLTLDVLLPAYKQCDKRLFCFGYDGTLVPWQDKTRRLGAPSAQVLAMLQQLCDDTRNQVWVISGQDELALERGLGAVRGLGLAAEQGMFLKYPHATRWVNGMEHVDMDWKNDVIELFSYYTERTNGSFIEHKRSAVTWHYALADDPPYAAFQAKECQNHLEHAILSKLPVEIVVGRKTLQVRPISFSKGDMLKRLLKPDADFIFCAGRADRSAEDMFRTLLTMQQRHRLPPKDTENLQNSQNPQKEDKTATPQPSRPIFSVLVDTNSQKPSLATWHVPAMHDLVTIFAELTQHT
ncbi:glycosyltransferase family 20-domain-containing protein [Gongronella butleri]|nr:glycosyltransferase family 20-domain-containing protein [Gongronella butleri]